MTKAEVSQVAGPSSKWKGKKIALILLVLVIVFFLIIFVIWWSVGLGGPRRPLRPHKHPPKHELGKPKKHMHSQESLELSSEPDLAAGVIADLRSESSDKNSGQLRFPLNEQDKNDNLKLKENLDEYHLPFSQDDESMVEMIKKIFVKVPPKTSFMLGNMILIAIAFLMDNSSDKAKILNSELQPAIKFLYQIRKKLSQGASIVDPWESDDLLKNHYDLVIKTNEKLPDKGKRIIELLKIFDDHKDEKAIRLMFLDNDLFNKSYDDLVIFVRSIMQKRLTEACTAYVNEVVSYWQKFFNQTHSNKENVFYLGQDDIKNIETTIQGFVDNEIVDGSLIKDLLANRYAGIKSE